MPAIFTSGLASSRWLGDAENARHEIAGHENAAPCCRGGKCETWKCEKRDRMEHRVLHMSVHCRAGMHESTRKSTRFPVSAPTSQDMCEVCLIAQRDAGLAFVPCGHRRFCASCVAHLDSRITGARVPHLPRFSYIYTRCAVSCAVNCLALIICSLFNFIPRIFAILKTTTGRTLRLR